jgi:hypothetical protein
MTLTSFPAATLATVIPSAGSRVTSHTRSVTHPSHPASYRVKPRHTHAAPYTAAHNLHVASRLCHAASHPCLTSRVHTPALHKHHAADPAFRREHFAQATYYVVQILCCADCVQIFLPEQPSRRTVVVARNNHAAKPQSETNRRVYTARAS